MGRLRIVNKKIVITGATSFIGDALIRRLLTFSYRVIAIVNPKSNRKVKIYELQKTCFPKQLNIVEADLSEITSHEIISLCRDSYATIHIGWYSNFENPRYNLVGQMKNVVDGLRVIDFSKEIGCRVFLGIGSQAECGVLKKKLNEDTPNNPQTAYAIAKCKLYESGKIKCEEYGIKFLWARILSVYGPGDAKHTMIMSAIRAALGKEEIELTGCEQIWDYLYVDDAASAIQAILERGTHGVKYTVSAGEEKPLYEYIKRISFYTHNDRLLDAIGKKEYAENQVMYLSGDITRLKEDTTWQPLIDFDEGIQRTIKSCME